MKHTLSYEGSGLVATGGEAWPVVEVDNLDGAVGSDNAVAAIDFDIKNFRSLLAYVAESPLLERESLAFAIDCFQPILAVALVVGIKPIKEWLVANAIEFHEVTDEMAVDDGTFYSAVEILMEHLLSLLRMAAITHVFLMHGMEIATFDPAPLETGFLKGWRHILVGAHNETFRIWHTISQENPRHALAGAVFNTISRINHKTTFVFKMLEQFYGCLLTTHVEDYVFIGVGNAERLLAIYVDLAAPLAELRCSGIENCSIIANMIWRESAGSHHTGYFYFCHYCWEVELVELEPSWRKAFAAAISDA